MYILKANSYVLVWNTLYRFEVLLTVIAFSTAGQPCGLLLALSENSSHCLIQIVQIQTKPHILLGYNLIIECIF